MTKRSPSIYNHSIENMKQKIEDMKQLGYSQDDIIKMTKNSPSIYSLSIENMKQKIEEMKQLGYSQEDIIKMTKSLPGIYGYSIENMKQKIDFYDSIGLHSIFVVDTKKLMQSVALSYARYMFYQSKGINIDATNYNKLFMSQTQFEKQYGIKKEEILQMYDYKEYMERIKRGQKNVQELGIETVAEQNDVGLLDKIETREGKAIEDEENLQK